MSLQSVKEITVAVPSVSYHGDVCMEKVASVAVPSVSHQGDVCMEKVTCSHTQLL